MKIAICDDDVHEIEVLYKNISRHRSDHEIHKFTSSTPFMERLFAGEHFDLLFLDVQMPDSDGWEIAKVIKESNNSVYIAMVTVLEKYIYDCFDRVDWFAPKPLSQEKVFQILDNVQERICPTMFAFQSIGASIALPVLEIFYIEVQRNDLLIHSLEKTFEARMTLKQAMTELENTSCFVQIHKSFIINLVYFKEIDRSDIVLRNGERLRMTRTYRNKFFQCLAEYIRGV